MEIVNGICVVRFACDGPFANQSVQIADKSARITDEVCGGTAHVVTRQLAPEWEQAEDLTWKHSNGTVVTLRKSLHGASTMAAALPQESSHSVWVRKSSVMRWLCQKREPMRFGPGMT